MAATFRVGQHHYLGPLYEDRSLTHALTDTASTDLTIAEHATPLGAQPQCPTVSCAYRAEGWPQSLTTRSSSMLSSARVADPAFSRAGALDVRYLAAAGAGEAATPTKQRRSRLWSKPVNVRTWELQLRLVLDPIVMYMPSVRADTLVSRPGLLSTNCKHLSTNCRQKT